MPVQSGAQAATPANAEDHARRNFAVSTAANELLYCRAMVNSCEDAIGSRGGEFAWSESQAALDTAIENLQFAIGDTGATVSHNALPLVYGDLAQLTQVFQNLIENALKFRRTEPPRVRVSAVHRPGAWEFCVADNGIGIAPAHHERIFLLFQRSHTRTEYPGTSIGLPVCKRVVERHRRRIWVDSEPGRGSAFLFHHRGGMP
ncbi:MAG: ATP-binding protein [Terriglobales bacterium]